MVMSPGNDVYRVWRYPRTACIGSWVIWEKIEKHKRDQEDIRKRSYFLAIVKVCVCVCKIQYGKRMRSEPNPCSHFSHVHSLSPASLRHLRLQEPSLHLLPHLPSDTWVKMFQPCSPLHPLLLFVDPKFSRLYSHCFISLQALVLSCLIYHKSSQQSCFIYLNLDYFLRIPFALLEPEYFEMHMIISLSGWSISDL